MRAFWEAVSGAVPGAAPVAAPAGLLASLLAGLLAAAPLLAQAGPATPPLDHCPSRVAAFGEVEAEYLGVSPDEFPSVALRLDDGRTVRWFAGLDAGGPRIPVGTRVRMDVERVQFRNGAEDVWTVAEPFGPAGACVMVTTVTSIRPAGAPAGACPERILSAGEMEAAYQGTVWGSPLQRLELKLDDGKTVEVAIPNYPSSYAPRKGERVRVSMRRRQGAGIGDGLGPAGRCPTNILATSLSPASETPPPPPVVRPEACPPLLLAAGEVEGLFGGIGCAGGVCRLAMWLPGPAAMSGPRGAEGSYEVEGALGDFKAPIGVRIRARVERRQTPDPSPSGPGCRIAETAVSLEGPLTGPPAALPPLGHCPTRIAAFGEVEGDFKELIRAGEADFLVLGLDDGREAIYGLAASASGFRPPPPGTRLRASVARFQERERLTRLLYGRCLMRDLATSVRPASGTPSDPCPEAIVGAEDLEAAFVAVACDEGCRVVLRLDDGRLVEIPASADLGEFRARPGTRVRLAVRNRRAPNRAGVCASAFEATWIGPAADTPAPPPPGPLEACPEALLAAGEVRDFFRGIDCAPECRLFLYDTGPVRLDRYEAGGDVRSFRAPVGALVKADVERRQAPGRGRAAGRCLLVETAKSATVIR